MNCKTSIILLLCTVFFGASVAAASPENDTGVQTEALEQDERGDLTSELPDELSEESEKAMELVIVTGSRIPRDGFESLQPTSVLGREEFELRGNFNIADSLNEQPLFRSWNSPVSGGSTIGFGSTVGQNFANLLGLGPQRTLTLVNGQRFPAAISPGSGAGGLQVDINTIPSAIVDRVETITIGGAPIYGADAIAGTVNFILRDDYEGLELLGQYGQSPRYGDAKNFRVSATWGKNFAGGRGNLVLAADYNEVASLLHADRPATATYMSFLPPADPESPYTFVLYDNLIATAVGESPLPLFFGNSFFLNVFGNGIPMDITDPGSPLTQFDANGNLVPFVLGAPAGSPVYRVGGDGFDNPKFNTLYTGMKRYHANVFLNYAMTDSVTFKSELWFARTEGTMPANQTLYNMTLLGGLPRDGYGSVGEGPIPILMDNPYLTEQARGIIEAALNVVHDADGNGIADPTIDTDGDGVPDRVGFWRDGSLTAITGKNPTSSRQDLQRLVVGFEGAIDLSGRNYTWDSFFTYGSTNTNQNHLSIIQPNFDQAVQVVADQAGNPICVDPSGACVPLNVIGTPSAEAIDYVSEMVSDKVKIEQTVFSANIAGDILDLPAGPLGFASGISYRKEKASYQPNSLAVQGLTRYPLTALEGEFHTSEVYAEILAPLLGGQLETPWVNTLEFEAAARLVSNSVTGTDTTWTVGLRYAPIADLLFRGNLTQSIRAPSITELFTPETPILSQAGDPCDLVLIDQGNYPERRAANCAADGVSQPFYSMILRALQQGTRSGNDQLMNEVADSFAIGFVLMPRFLEGFTASVDWVDVDIDDAISNLSLTQIMQGCYDSAAFPAEPACDQFSRDATGQVDDFQVGYVNIDRIHTAGLQVTMNQILQFERHGSLNLALNYFYTDKYEITSGSENPVDIAGSFTTARHRLTASAGWNTGNWTWYTMLRYISGGPFSTTDDEFTRDVSGVSDWCVVNTSVAYEINEHWAVQLNIDNVLDENEPSASMAAPSGVAQYYSGVLGRMARVSVRAWF